MRQSMGCSRLCVDYRKLNYGPVGRVLADERQEGGSGQDGVHLALRPLSVHQDTGRPPECAGTFQRLIDRFRTRLEGMTLHAYLDDLVLLSANRQDHLVQLRCVFQEL